MLFDKTQCYATYKAALKVLDEIWMIPPDVTAPLTITVDQVSTTIVKLLSITEIDSKHRDHSKKFPPHENAIQLPFKYPIYRPIIVIFEH